jgi:branched-chain amino acid transport system substrate-binding protein
MKNVHVWKALVISLFIFAWLPFTGGCSNNEKVLIGFAAELSGRQSELGVQERNGAQLAVEEINASGGIHGRMLELIVRDDHGSQEGGVAADKELIAAGAVAIIGHATSNVALAILPVIDAAHVVLISPTSSAPMLSGASKYFFRVVASNSAAGAAMAVHAKHRRGVDKMAALYDVDNASYTTSYLKSFTEKYQAIGGEMTAEAAFSSSTQPDFAPLLETMRANGAQGLLVITSGYDAAHIAQRARLMNWPVPIFGCGWTESEGLINNGGQAVEGMVYDQYYPRDHASPRLSMFRERFEARFGRTPSFGAVNSYDATVILAEALKRTDGKGTELRQALLSIKEFKGLIDAFSFDANGDIVRPFYIGGVKNGRFVTVDTIPSNTP